MRAKVRDADIAHIDIVTNTRQLLLTLMQCQLVTPEIDINPFPLFAVTRSTA